MEQQSAVYLDALGANVALSPAMKQELDTLGYTVVHNVVDSEWLAAMRALIDAIVEREGDNLAIEHHQEATATRIANLINKGAIWEKVWSHPLILSACRHVFQGDFKVSSLNAREALFDGGHQPLHADWKKPRNDFPKVHLVNTIWAIDDLSAENGAPRIIPG
ncbi:MAG: phytanoyl-CoA dioxygenase family protein, partial [Klebsiella michiganensis]|nr:phytanoyl-CoA dioxygenase family protein [Klebsiella michiganensis]